MKKYTSLIGLELHIEPNTKSKMFCACPQDHFAKKPNTQTCPICLGLPGVLPFANKEGILKTIKLGLALGCTISKLSKFYRKNYFYPDLPKGFQTSQLDSPFCMGGILNGIKINHIHLEEDAGKLVHETINAEKYSLIDFNRSGCALIELVTEPVFHDTEPLKDVVKELQLIARYVNIRGADREKGSMRLEANISLSPDGNIPDYKVELKNINSFRFLEKAVNAELARQEKALNAGEKLIQETRGYDEVKQVTFSQRTKAEAQDYRYFPEADLPPMKFPESEVESLRLQIPELPEKKRKRFAEKYKLPKDFIDILVSDQPRADYFEEVLRLVSLTPDKPIPGRIVADLMVNKKMDDQFPEPAGLIRKIIELTNVEYSSEDEVKSAVNLAIMDNQKAVADYQNGKGEVVGFLMGMVQKRLEGRGNPAKIRETLLTELQKNGK